MSGRRRKRTNKNPSPDGNGGGSNAKESEKLNSNSKQEEENKKKRINGTIRCATWNIQGWNTKQNKVKEEFKKNNLDILIMTETYTKGSGIDTSTDGLIYYWSGVKQNPKTGVGILIKTEIQNSNFKPINERLIRLNVSVLDREMVILGVYAPCKATSKIQREFIETLQQQIKMVGANQELILAGDFNARTGNWEVPGTNKEVIGEFGEKTINPLGIKLKELCENMKLQILNGFFNNEEKYTWYGRGLESIIDYFIMRIDRRVRVTNVKVEKEANCGSDHRLLVATMTKQ